MNKFNEPFNKLSLKRYTVAAFHKNIKGYLVCISISNTHILAH